LNVLLFCTARTYPEAPMQGGAGLAAVMLLSAAPGGPQTGCCGADDYVT